jgi:hypothetical protein
MVGSDAPPYPIAPAGATRAVPWQADFSLRA